MMYMHYIKLPGLEIIGKKFQHFHYATRSINIFVSIKVKNFTIINKYEVVMVCDVVLMLMLMLMVLYPFNSEYRIYKSMSKRLT